MMGRLSLGLWLISLGVLLGSCSEAATGGSETPIDIARKVQRAGASRPAFGVKEGDPVAMFVFSQFADDTIRLTIQNIVNSEDVKSISFAFDVSFEPQVVSPEMPPWSNEGAVTNLKGTQIADAGIIAASETPASMGEIVIKILGEITYK